MEEKTQENPLTGEKKCNFSCCSCSWWKIVLCVILGLLIVAGAVYAGIQIGKKQVTPPELIPIDNGPVEIEVSPIPTIDPTANWKTYKNEKSGFEFKYPAGWFLRENSINSVDLFNFQGDIKEETGKGFFMVNILQNDFNYSSLTEWFNAELKIYSKSGGGRSMTKIISETAVGGYPALKTDDLGPGVLTGTGISYYVNRGGKLFKISIKLGMGETENTYTGTILDQILSTFRFLE